MNFYAIKNKFSDTFNQPFPEENDAKAIYSVRMMINQERDPAIIAGDFALYRVGFFDTKDGMFPLFEDFPICLIDDLSKLKVKKEVSE